MSIKKLNNANPTAKRPLRVEDLQDIWSGLSSAFAQYGTPRIISGMLLSSNGYLTAGCIARQGELYFYDGGSNIQEGSNLYVARIPDDDDMRTLSDGTIQPFSYLNIVTADSTVAGASYIGQATRTTLDAWRAPIIPDRYISSVLIANDTLRPDVMTDIMKPTIGFRNITVQTASEFDIDHSVVSSPQGLIMPRFVCGQPGGAAANVTITSRGIVLGVDGRPTRMDCLVFNTSSGGMTATVVFWDGYTERSLDIPVGPLSTLALTFQRFSPNDRCCLISFNHLSV